MISNRWNSGIPIKYIISLLMLFVSFFYSAMSGLFWIALFFAIVSGYYISTLRIRRELILYSIILILVFQNFIIGVGAHLASNATGLSYLTQVPLFFVVGIFLGSDLKNIEYERSMFYFILLLIFIAVSLLIGRGTFNAIFANLRNLVFFYIVYYISKRVMKKNFSMHYFVSKLVILGVFILVIGIILLIGGFPLYKIIGVNEVYVAKSASLDALSLTSLDDRFYSDIIGFSVNRMGSLYYEPVSLGYLLVGMYLFTALFDWTNNLVIKNLSKIVLLIGILLSFGKGSFLILLLSVCAPVLHRSFKQVFSTNSDNLVFNVSVVLIPIFVYFFSTYYNAIFGGAVGNHFMAIAQTWPNILSAPLGHGMGTGGNAAKTFSSVGPITNNEWLSTGGETALLAFGYQIGLPGMIALILTFLSISKRLLRNMGKYINLRKNSLLTIIYLPAIIVITSIFQDNTFAPQCISIYMMLLAAPNIYLSKNA